MGHRKFSHVFDGYAKLAKFSFKGDRKTARYTNKFLQSLSYRSSRAKDDIDNYFILAQPIPEFNFIEKIEELVKGFDNINVNVVKYGSDLASVSDSWKLYTFNRSDLSTLKPVYPTLSDEVSRSLKTALSTGHPMRVPGTDHWINIATEVSLRGSQVLKVVLIKSANERQLITKFQVNRNYVLHSFGMTKNYAIYFAHPCHFEPLAMLKSMEVINAMKWDDKSPTFIYVVNLNTGRVRKLTTEPRFFLHQINSYEVYNKDGNSNNITLVVDWVTYDNVSALTQLTLKNLMNTTTDDWLANDSQTKRYTLHLNNGTVTPKSYTSKAGTIFDFPVINEEVRYQKYCYVYGMHGNNTINTSITKKNM